MMKPRISCLLLLSILTLVGAACTSTVQVENSTGALQSGAVLFVDDFSKTTSGWGTWNREGAVVEYHNDGLRILVEQNQYDFWSVAGRSFNDVQVESDVTKIGGPDDNDFGLICRYQDKDNFYMLVISSDGYFGIAKMKEGQYSMITSDQLQYSSAIAQGQAANRLRADCIGANLSLYANGQKLIEVQDTDFPSGDVGLIAGAYDTPGVDVLFDNFIVKKP